LFEQELQTAFKPALDKSQTRIYSKDELKELSHQELDHLKLQFGDVIADTLLQFLHLQSYQTASKEPPTLWILVDSLNVLGHLTLVRTLIKNNRTAVQGLLTAIQRRLKGAWVEKFKVILIFTGEYFVGAPPSLDAGGESFFSDVEILLAPEAIVGVPRTNPRNCTASGYSIELQHQLSGLDHQAANPSHHSRTVVEARPFCRVLKCRFGKNQSRRCAYDIVAQTGIKLTETYPGDGEIMLFAENARQIAFWHEFLGGDIPRMYPALRYEQFGRPALQRIFATQRYFDSVPERTDLYLACFDTYWIQWYLELYQRSGIDSIMAEFLTNVALTEAERCSVESDVHFVTNRHTSAEDATNELMLLPSWSYISAHRAKISALL